MNIKKALQTALKYHSIGDLKKAEKIYKDILEKDQDNFYALHMLGVIFYEIKNYKSAIEYFKKANQYNENDPYLFYHLGNALLENNQVEEAISNFQKSIKIDPNFADTYNSLGICYRKKWQYSDAISCYQKALQLKPNFIAAYVNLGNALLDQGQNDLAIPCYQKALEFNPNLAEAYYGLGISLTEKKDLDQAIAYYRKAIQLNPNHTSSYYNLGNILRDAGHQNEALFTLDTLIRKDPHNFKARWAHCFCQLPIIYEDVSGIEESRKLYSSELIAMREMIFSKTFDDIEAASEALGTHQPFYLPYQGGNDRELQEIYGSMVYNIMSLKYPQWAHSADIPLKQSGGQLRIGFVSGFFHQHSIWKLFRGWFKNLDENRFKLHGYYTGKKKDKETEIARQYFSHFAEDNHSFEELCKAIKNDNLNMLIYPEIGIDHVSSKMAALRLAPIQCVSWGHPETTGLPSIDYFLSSDLMEPRNADDHYSEKLIRLPNLAIYYSPLDVPIVKANRETFGLRANSVLYLCCQSLFKYLPQHDYIFPRIAEQVGDCQFLFISYPKSHLLTEKFKSRLSKAFNNFGLDSKDYLVFLPSLDPGKYNALNDLSDVYLDSIGWSGGNTTLEAVACNLPIITCSGEFMRGRHSSAILTMMGITETIAPTIDEYIELAIKLGKDPEYRQHISKNISERKEHLYYDKSCISALEKFIEFSLKK